MPKATTITVTEKCTIYAFSVIPMTRINEFLENVAMLVKKTDVLLGEEMGWWKIA